MSVYAHTVSAHRETATCAIHYLQLYVNLRAHRQAEQNACVLELIATLCNRNKSLRQCFLGGKPGFLRMVA